MENTNINDTDDDLDYDLDLPDNYESLSPLEKAQAAMKAKRDAGEEVERLTPIEKALRKPTPGNCIKAKCFECMGGDVGWKWQIGNCTSKNCPLYPVRSYRTMEGRLKPKGL